MVPLAGMDIPISNEPFSSAHIFLQKMRYDSEPPWFASDVGAIKKSLTAFVFGAPSRNRTSTPLREADFESAASTSSAIGAFKMNCRSGIIYGYCLSSRGFHEKIYFFLFIGGKWAVLLPCNTERSLQTSTAGKHKITLCFCPAIRDF